MHRRRHVARRDIARCASLIKRRTSYLSGDRGQLVTIELDTAPPGQPAVTQVVQPLTVNTGELASVILLMRTLDCGAAPNSYTANSYSNDASLLLPTTALGERYRVIGWSAGHPVPIALPNSTIVDRSYITVVDTQPETQVTVRPSWRIKGNPPVAAILEAEQPPRVPIARGAT